jgi:hypothetical protein
MIRHCQRREGEIVAKSKQNLRLDGISLQDHGFSAL